MEGGKYFSSLSCSICEGHNSFFSSKTEENMFDGKKESVSITTFTK